jgi:hypothetical protein
VDVLTRYYDAAQQKGNSMLLGSLSPAGFVENHIVSDGVVYTNFSDTSREKRISRRLPPGVRGVYNYYQTDIWHQGWIGFALKAYEQELATNHYDLIVASYGPPAVMKLATLLHQKYKIPFVIDFRDSYIDERDHGFHRFMKLRVQDKLLRNAAGVVFATEGMKDYFFRSCGKALSQLPAEVVYNGVEEASVQTDSTEDQKIIERFHSIKSEYRLTLLHSGTFYNGQNIRFFFEALGSFNNNAKEVAIVFLGAAENNNKQLPESPHVFMLPKVSHSASLMLQRQASALLLPVWDGRYTGFSGKTLEYLASENLIICSPQPQEDLMEFFRLSGNVLLPENVKALQELLKNMASGELRPRPNSQQLTAVLKRSYWVAKLGAFLKSLNDGRH